MKKYGLDDSAFKNLNEKYSVSELQGFVEKFRLYQKDDDAGLIIENGYVTGIEISA
jgi:hypothetical protein